MLYIVEYFCLVVVFKLDQTQAFCSTQQMMLISRIFLKTLFLTKLETLLSAAHPPLHCLRKQLLDGLSSESCHCSQTTEIDPQYGLGSQCAKSEKNIAIRNIT